MDANLIDKLNGLCAYAWRTTGGGINAGGCAGFAVVVGAIAAAHKVSAWGHLWSHMWEAGDVAERWQTRRRNTPHDVQSSHVVCCVEIAGIVYAVDAEFGVMPLADYVQRLQREADWYFHADFRVSWRMAWRAYKIKRLWNDWFNRDDMRKIVRRARREFGSFSLVRP